MAQPPMNQLGTIESVRIRGFRFLADVELSGLPRASVLIGPNGSGKSNFIRFFEMVSWMLKTRKLGEFIAKERALTTNCSAAATKFLNRRRRLGCGLPLGETIANSRFRMGIRNGFFTDESFQFDRAELENGAEWQLLGSGHLEVRIVEVAQSTEGQGVNRLTASTIVRSLRNRSVY